MSIEEQLQRQININLQLRKQLETARKDAVEYCAKFCEDHDVGFFARAGWKLGPRTADLISNPGTAYANGLRGIIGG